jgi:acyl carrier protein
VVVASEDELGEQRLVAYVVRNSAYEGPQLRGSATSPIADIETDGGQPWRAHADNPLLHMHLQALDPELRRFLRAKLPDYMVPAAFVMLESLPLTPTGKLDRKALPTPSQRGSEPKKTYTAPRTPVEQVLVKMYADVLALARVGINDNFFTDLGGHSLLATQLVSRIRDNFLIELPLQAVFNKPTVGELGQELLGDPSQKSRLTRIAEILLTLTESSEDEIKAKLL